MSRLSQVIKLLWPRYSVRSRKAINASISCVETNPIKLDGKPNDCHSFVCDSSQETSAHNSSMGSGQPAAQSGNTSSTTFRRTPHSSGLQIRAYRSGGLQAFSRSETARAVQLLAHRVACAIPLTTTSQFSWNTLAIWLPNRLQKRRIFHLPLGTALIDRSNLPSSATSQP